MAAKLATLGGIPFPHPSAINLNNIIREIILTVCIGLSDLTRAYLYPGVGNAGIMHAGKLDLARGRSRYICTQRCTRVSIDLPNIALIGQQHDMSLSDWPGDTVRNITEYIPQRWGGILKSV